MVALFGINLNKMHFCQPINRINLNKMKNYFTLTVVGCALSLSVVAQTTSTTGETRMLSDTSKNGTTIGGYGNAFYQRDNNLETAKMNLERFVLFAGHRFNKNFSFFSELEVEDAKVSGGEEGGEVALEQCYIQYNVDARHYWKFGLFIPQIGILNANHLPENYNGNERNGIETLLIPSTWRELGVSYHASLSKIPLNYSIALVNGLNSAGFEHGTVIRGGRFEGRDASANNLALTGAVDYTYKKFTFQVSGYYGGSVGLSPREADSLGLESGIFGSAVGLAEGDIRYTSGRLAVKVLATTVSIPKAASINRAYANNTPALALGGYAEVAYSIYKSKSEKSKANLIAFARFEDMNLNADIPTNGIDDPTLDKQNLVIGFTYLPISNIVFKADVRFLTTGEQNPDLIINPSPTAPEYKTNNSFINLGIGYSF